MQGKAYEGRGFRWIVAGVVFVVGCSSGEDSEPPASRSAIVAGLWINQGTQISIESDGSMEPDSLVQGRPGRVTVEARRLAGAQNTTPQRLDVHLIWTSSEGDRVEFGPSALTIAAGSPTGRAAVWLPEEAMVPGAALRVVLRDAEGEPKPAEGAPAVLPSWDDHPLALPVAPGDLVLDMKLIPVELPLHGCDAPILSEERLQRWHDALLSRLPVRAVNLSVAPTFVWPGQMQTEQQQLALMEAVRERRLQDPAPFRLYAAVYEQCVYCTPDCGTGVGSFGDGTKASQVLLLAIQPDASEAFTAYILVHEVGHNFGRSHTWCPGMVGGPRPEYPAAQGLLDAMGLDILSGEEYLPEDTYDFMSYCRPTWTSGFTWRGIFEYARAYMVAAGAQRTAPRRRTDLGKPPVAVCSAGNPVRLE